MHVSKVFLIYYCFTAPRAGVCRRVTCRRERKATWMEVSSLATRRSTAFTFSLKQEWLQRDWEANKLVFIQLGFTSRNKNSILLHAQLPYMPIHLGTDPRNHVSYCLLYPCGRFLLVRKLPLASDNNIFLAISSKAPLTYVTYVCTYIRILLYVIYCNI
jgi:hypothetical protein